MVGPHLDGTEDDEVELVVPGQEDERASPERAARSRRR